MDRYHILLDKTLVYGCYAFPPPSIFFPFEVPSPTNADCFSWSVQDGTTKYKLSKENTTVGLRHQSYHCRSCADSKDPQLFPCEAQNWTVISNVGRIVCQTRRVMPWQQQPRSRSIFARVLTRFYPPYYNNVILVPNDHAASWSGWWNKRNKNSCCCKGWCCGLGRVTFCILSSMMGNNSSKAPRRSMQHTTSNAGYHHQDDSKSEYFSSPLSHRNRNT